MSKTIKRTIGSNFKGQNFELHLAPVTWVSGPNWSGKSTRVQCALLAYAGWLPSVGSTGPDLFERLSSGGVFSCRNDYSDGSYVERSWAQRNGSIKGTASGDKDAEVPDECVDATEFLKLSDEARTRYLFKAGTLPEEFTVAKLVDGIVTDIKNIKCEPHAEVHEAAIRTACQEVIASTVATTKDRTTQDWLTALVESVGEKKKAAVANVQRLEKTLQGLTQTAANAPVPPADAERKLHAAKESLEKAVAEVSRLEAEGRAAGKALKETEALAATAVDTEETQREIDRLEEASKAESPEAGPMPKPQRLAGDRPTCDAARKALDAACRKANELDGEVKRCEADVARIESSIAAAQGCKTCPTCKQNVEHLQAVVIKGYQDERSKATRALEKARNEAKKFSTAEAVEGLNKAEKAVKDYDAASMSLSVGYQNALAEWEKRNSAHLAAQHSAKVNRERAQQLKDKVAANAAACEAAGKLPPMRMAYENLRTAYAEAKVEEHEKRVAVQVADTAHRQLLAARAEEATRARTAAELEKGRAEAEVVKRVADLLADLQGKLVAKAVGPFLERCNALCAPMLKGPLAYRDGKLGMDEPTGFHSWNTFSGTERVITYAAVSAACAQTAPIKLVVLDEFDMEEKNLSKVATMLCDLQAKGIIDQALIAHTTCPECIRDNFKEIKLGVA